MSDGAKPEEEEAVEAKPWVKEPERFVPAHDCLRLRFVGGAAGSVAAELAGDGFATEPAANSFTPQYVHQIFDNEAIELPSASRPLKMEVLYTAASLDLWIRCADDAEPKDAAMDALYALAAELPTPCASLEAFTQAAEAPFDPASVGGDLLETYTVGTQSYSVYCCAVQGDAARKAFAERMQSIYRWYIEGYSSIDLDDERWRLLAVFETIEPAAEGAPPTYRLVSAATVFNFTRWVDGGSKLLMRVCQIAVLPGHRERGHGTRLLEAVYSYARAQGAVQVTVEDANPEFRMLRDLTDVRNCTRRGLLTPSSCDKPPTEAQLAEGRTALLLTDEQLLRCYELQQLGLLTTQPGVTAGPDGIKKDGAGMAEGVDVEKPFRLAVKRRLSKRHREELDGVAFAAAQPDGESAEGAPSGEGIPAMLAKAQHAKQVGNEARKRRLDELYTETVAEYKVLAKRLK